jgi:DNA-binding transcriptional LysR family regulator
MSLLHPGLQAFIAVVDQSTVYGAAREIGLSQTGVTQRIRALERQIGTTLFTRSRKGMRPTSEGEALYRYCQRVIDLEGELLPSLQDKDETQEINVNLSGPSSMMRCRIIPAAMSILSKFNNITFSFNLDDYESGLDHLKSGKSQLAVLERHQVVNELDSKLLKPANYILVASPKWKSREALDIVKNERIIDFNKKDETTFNYLKKFRLFKTAKKRRHLTNNIDALARLVAEGFGYSVLIEDFAAPLLKKGEIVDINPGKVMKQEFALAWYPRHEMPGYFDRIITEID